jgi:hypothetical protein
LLPDGKIISRKISGEILPISGMSALIMSPSASDYRKAGTWGGRGASKKKTRRKGLPV